MSDGARFAYVVGWEDGEYSDYSHKIVAVCTSVEAAERVIAEQAARDVAEQREWRAAEWDNAAKRNKWPAVDGAWGKPRRAVSREEWVSQPTTDTAGGYYVRRYGLNALGEYEEICRGCGGDA